LGGYIGLKKSHYRKPPVLASGVAIPVLIVSWSSIIGTSLVKTGGDRVGNKNVAAIKRFVVP